jgi:hypothetical protein
LKRSNNIPKEHSTVVTFSVFGAGLSIELPSALAKVYIDTWFPRMGGGPFQNAMTRNYRVVFKESSPAPWEISIDDDVTARYSNLQKLLNDLESDMQMYIAEFATPYLFVHAGVVAWNGTAILLPGRSFAGKSTLVTSLVQAGATYYSDEYAVLDDEGRVWPYRRRVSLRNGPHGPARRLDLARDDAPCEPLPVSLIALLQYTPGGSWHVERRTPGEAIMRLVDQTVAVRHRPADTLAYLSRLIENAIVIEGTRGEVDDSVRRLLLAAEQDATYHSIPLTTAE